MNPPKENWEKYSASLNESRDFHSALYKASTNPTRIRILRSLIEGAKNEKELEKELDVPTHILRYHLEVLEQYFCIYRLENGKYELTKEGEWVKYNKK
jgi:predicted transcriptional regulator